MQKLLMQGHMVVYRYRLCGSPNHPGSADKDGTGENRFLFGFLPTSHLPRPRLRFFSFSLSILGRRAFKLGVTSTLLNPGIGDVGKEIVRCIDLAKDGIHAVLLVLSIRSRFSEEEEAVFHTLRTLFGNKIVSYMIAMFTGGMNLKMSQELVRDITSKQAMFQLGPLKASSLDGFSGIFFQKYCCRRRVFTGGALLATLEYTGLGMGPSYVYVGLCVYGQLLKAGVYTRCTVGCTRNIRPGMAWAYTRNLVSDTM
ncbi:hypothetical protein CRG98_022407 [Punica granatum]|uniref:AIG1-type G domain-containing protein n=1 Tax=Punica granatum TaxID=22663 RepID=A0A2I0JLQ7_PUNGR|nr:hypothetical protein CRG98_022407 [Punica granatum]